MKNTDGNFLLSIGGKGKIKNSFKSTVFYGYGHF